MSNEDNNEESIPLTGRRKAAAFLLSLDSEASGKLLSSLGERDISALTEEMARIKDLTAEEMESVWDDFSDAASTDIISVEPMLQAILEKALGTQKAKEMLEKIRRQSRDLEPFRSLRALNGKQILQILGGEHPQVMAIVMNYLSPAQSYELLYGLSEDVRYDVIRRIAQTEEMPIEMMREIDEVLEVRAYAMASQRTDGAGENRFKTVAQMLNLADPSMSKTIMDQLAQELPTVAENIQALMFVFEDLINVTPKDMQKILGDLDKAVLALALKTAPEEIANHILDNLSKRARDNIMEEIEMMGPKPLSEVEEAQKSILQQVRSMEEKGEITVSRGSSEEMV